MEFIVFWRLYAPLKKYANRYRACERLWESKDQRSQEWNLIDWEPDQLAGTSASTEPQDVRKIFRTAMSGYSEMRAGA